jgi:2'-5' RNA ligase
VVTVLSVRSFIAVDVEDPGLLGTLEGIQRGLLATGADVKCVERENIHITLRFLGDVGEGQLEGLKHLVKGLELRPFPVEFRGVGAFPNLRRPRVVWARLAAGADGLAEIFRRLEDSIVDLGFRREARGFSPHVTLARVRSGRNREALIEEILGRSEEPLGEMVVERVRLKKSVLTPRGPIYSKLAESTLIQDGL